jgi:MFS family permease
MVGLARASQALGQCLSPLFSATLIEHRRRVLPMGITIGSLMRVQVLGIALAGFFLGFLGPGFNLALVCLFLGLFGFFSGMQGVIFNFLMSKVIPVSLRGRLTGIRNALAGLISAAVAYLGGTYLIDTNALGNGYAATFLLAFVLTEIGLLMLSMMREPESPGVRARSGMVSRLADLPALMREDRNFGAYIAACTMGALGRMAMPYYVLYAQRSLSIGGKELGLLTAAFLLTSMCVNLVWGWIADHRGFRAVFVGSLGLWIAGTLALLATQSLISLVAVFAILGAGSGGFMMGQQNLVLEFGNREDLPLRIGLANSSSEAMGVLAPPLGGVLATWVSYPAVFWAAIGFKLVAMWIVIAHLREPRSTRTDPA